MIQGMCLMVSFGKGGDVLPVGLLALRFFRFFFIGNTSLFSINNSLGSVTPFSYVFYVIIWRLAQRIKSFAQGEFYNLWRPHASKNGKTPYEILSEKLKKAA